MGSDDNESDDADDAFIMKAKLREHKITKLEKRQSIDYVLTGVL
jgi:hypothetical protein